MGGFPAPSARSTQRGRYIGIGLAHGLKGTGRGPFEMGLVRVSGTGRVSVLTGASAMGQGLATALAQICAAELGVHPQTISVVAGDSSVVPVGLGGFASRQTVTAGNSVMLAAREVARKAKALAGMLLQASPDDLELAGGGVRMKERPNALFRSASSHGRCAAGRVTRSRRASRPDWKQAPLSGSTCSPMPMRAMWRKSRSMLKQAACASCAISPFTIMACKSIP